MLFLLNKNIGNFWNYDRRGYQKSPDDKNSPELDELERDLIPVQFLASNFKKQKSYSISPTTTKKKQEIWLMKSTFSWIYSLEPHLPAHLSNSFCNQKSTFKVALRENRVV